MQVYVNIDNIAQVWHMLLLEVCRTKPGAYAICAFGDFMSTPEQADDSLNALNTTWTLILNLYNSTSSNLYHSRIVNNL